VGYGLSVAPQNRRKDEDSMRHASRSSSLLRLEASWARVSQSDLKTGVGTTQMVHVTSSQRSRGDEDENKREDTTSCIRPCYPYFAILTVLGPKSVYLLFFWLGL
jgi:hypothetical protein